MKHRYSFILLVITVLGLVGLGSVLAREPGPPVRERVAGRHALAPWPAAMRWRPGLGQAQSPAQAAGWADLMTETFETAFPANKWRFYGNPTWARTTYRAAGGSYSGYATGAGSQAVGPPGPYPANANSWMVFGPFDLSQATDAEVTYFHWTKTEFTSDSKHDDFCIFASIDDDKYHGECFFGNWTNEPGNVNGWNPATFDLTNVLGLGNLLGRNRVWIAFTFFSDATYATEGVYVDDIALRVHTGPTPTPTPATPTPTPQACPGAAQRVYITQDDNENNALSGQPDLDMFPGTEHCLYQDDPRQPIEFRIFVPSLPAPPASARLSLLADDVDEQETSCPELDTVLFNGANVGKLTGADNAWSSTVLDIPPAAVVQGGNLVQVQINTQHCPSPTDPNDPKGRWCTRLDWGQLTLAGASAPASLRSVTPGFGCYPPGATMQVQVEADTSLGSQEVGVEVNLLAADQSNLVGSTQAKTIHAAQTDPFVFNLTLPASAATGDYTLQTILRDTCSATQSDYRQQTIRLDPTCATVTPTRTATLVHTPTPTPAEALVPTWLPIIVH